MHSYATGSTSTAKSFGLDSRNISFNTLTFGANKPAIGSCRDGQLDLFYYRDFGLKAGQSFPLWTIQ
jgi:hypothetical protein